jgi:tRNA (cmo5U34)-methyltransferase
MNIQRVAMKKNDAAGENIRVREASWTFGGKTPAAFSEHIHHSVPFYDAGHDLVCKLSDYFVKAQSVCYDLGTSTGVLAGKLARRHAPRTGAQWVGIDIEPAMIEQARKENAGSPNLELVVDDICLYPYEASDLITSYYTIQFVPPAVRQDLFDNVFNALNWGGAFIVFEKVRACDARFQDIIQTLYTDYKLDQGYTPTEIINKARSLKGILEPFSTQGNLDLLKRAGFVDIISVFKYLCFEGFLAIK